MSGLGSNDARPGVFDMPDPVRAVMPARAKLYPPRLRPGTVRRNEVIDRLRTADADAVLVTAAAGYGKSTMLAEFAALDARPAAWLSVDDADNDPTVLLAAIAIALDTIEAIDWDRFAGLMRGPVSVASSALRGFGWLLAERRVPFLLVLDDVHELVADGALDVVDALVAAVPDGSTVALAGRDGSRLHRGSLRRRRRIIEVDAAALAFDADDVAELSAGLGVDLGAQQIEEVAALTEGWPLAVYLSLQGLDDAAPERRQGATGGTSRALAQFFSDELLGRLEPETSEFLMNISVFDRVSGSLCDAVLERERSADLLESLEQQNMLVIALDDRREWYRLHHLWAEFLSIELEREERGAARELLARGSRWFEAHGDLDAAITSAAKAHDLDRVEQLVIANFPAYATTARLATVERWLALFDRTELRARPLLMVAAGYAKFGGGDGVAAGAWLSMVEFGEPVADGGDQLGLTPVVALALLRAGLATQSAAAMAADAQYAHARLAPGQDWQPVSCMLCGAAALLRGDGELAERMFRDGAFGAMERPLVRSVNLALLALVHVARDEWDRAVAAVDDLQATPVDDSVPLMCIVSAVRSVLDARAGEAERGVERRRLSRRQLAGYDGIAPWLTLQTRIALIRSALATGDRAEATTLLDEAEAMSVAVPDASGVREQLATLRKGVATRQNAASHGPSSLTTAELRVLQYLPTHLTLAEIAERLFVSRNTVKAQSIAIYRKLGTSSRGGAVDIARQAQLLD